MSEVAETTTTTQSEKIVQSQQPGELQNIQATYRLDGKNYLKWSQLVRTVLKRKKKINHLMTTHVCFRLQQRIFGTQSNRHIQKLDMQLKYMRLRVIKTKCPKDVAALKDFIEQDRVYDFIVGLNPEFDQVRIQILSKQEVPCFNEVQRPQVHMAKQPKTEENSATGGFNSEEMEKLRSLLGSLDKPTRTCFLAISEQGSGRRIGIAKEMSGLYHLESSQKTNNIL
ncbi:hypothetical protein CK203_068607 [Vitis vinifera]|uniref:Retrotransposon Copia-like N-terminal domain-containing protein n=1 Tax=Vitis vinifera TaxID=29760 RepID=A0A438EEQ6_VITVI|nr:hypothetical protein CK203_068607 [Vitis vinifera]